LEGGRDTTSGAPGTSRPSPSAAEPSGISSFLTISPPPTTLSCPKGQTATLISLSSTDVRITDVTNGIFEETPGTF